jgi:hypothetical protein
MDKHIKVAIWFICIALWAALLKPIFIPGKVTAGSRYQDVNIAAVGGRPTEYGRLFR